ncbi:uncharacterized protein LOC5510674 isoform X2 [Nematostella vectensis]|uniref:uncharacterized protein LOC5510674 isoform X2 n=1 Tax=Nematostella vectensis TaxID=45351 RepID=UPI0020773850|nr:uncharacterized protein LOC5510674 isoform X2 [Nematostella vectensis]
MAAKPKDYTVIPLSTNPSQPREQKRSQVARARDSLEQPFDEEFWNKVQDVFAKGGLSWALAMDEVRTDRLVMEYKEQTLQVLIRDWPQKEEYKGKPELIASLEHQIDRFTEIILDKDKNGTDSQPPEEHYKFFRVDEDDDQRRPTILHLAAERNFAHVAKTIVDHYPGLLYMPTEEYDDCRELLPVEVALIEFNDETAAYLIGHMRHEWVHDLFLCKGGDEKARFSFGEYIRHPHMKRTVVAVLDRLISPHWPYLPRKKDRYNSDQEERGIDMAWSSVPDDPMNYHFFYHLLDSDECGRVPKINGKINKNFTVKAKSNLHYLADSNNKEAIQHPVVRMLVMTKWRRFAHWWFGLQASFYLFFLFVMSFALIYGSSRPDPLKYDGKADGMRAFCEIATVILVMVYFYAECLQADKEGLYRYFRDPYNYFDWLGLTLTFLVIPLRFANTKVQWTVASIGFLFNFLRVFKFSCVTRTTGLYTKTLAKIVYRDMTRFMAVFVVIFLGFCGSLYISLSAMNSQALFSGFPSVMLVGIRALVEQNPVDEDYSKFKWLSVLIILVYMAMVVVILLNILIAQLSYTYAEAKKMAKLQYDIDRVLIVTKLEHSRFARFAKHIVSRFGNVASREVFIVYQEDLSRLPQHSSHFHGLTHKHSILSIKHECQNEFMNLRMKYYQEGDWIGEVKLAKELLEYSEDSSRWESIEEKLSLIRDMMRKVVKRLPVG